MHSDEKRLPLATPLDVWAELSPPEWLEDALCPGAFSGAPDLASGYLC